MMVDQACGIVKDEATKIAVADPETQALMNVGDAAKALVVALDNRSDTEQEMRVLIESTRELVKLGW